MKIPILYFLIVGAFARPQRRPLRVRGRSEIVGGTDAARGEFPYQLSLQEIVLGHYFHFCGASIYKPGVAISAAHCVSPRENSPEEFYIVAGEHNLAVISGDEQRVRLRKIIIHEKFNYDYTLVNDISLLFLSKDFVINSLVGPVKLPEQGQEFSGDFIVTGWGTLYEGGPTPNVLQKVTVPFVDDVECREDYSSNEIADSMICAGAEGVDSCQGDSGGPMTQDDVLVGIVSFGAGCANPGKPGVYTQVSYFIDWIQAHENS